MEETFVAARYSTFYDLEVTFKNKTYEYISGNIVEILKKIGLYDLYNILKRLLGLLSIGLSLKFPLMSYTLKSRVDARLPYSSTFNCRYDL